MSNGNNQQVDVLKKSLEMTTKFMEDRIKELETFRNFGLDTEPLEVLYQHFKELLEEMQVAPSPREFHDMMATLSQSIAGVLIVIKPASADEVMQNMQNANPGMDQQSFEDLINQINKGVSENAKADPNRSGTENDEEEDPDNDPEELIDMMELKEHVKKTGKKKKEAPKNEEKATDKEMSKENKSKGDPFKDIFKKYDQ